MDGYLAEHGGQHCVAPVHIAHILMQNDADETRTGQWSAGLGAPAGPRDTVIVVGRQEAAECRQTVAERRVTQVVAEGAEFPEGRRGVAWQRLLVIATSASRRRLYEARYIDVVESLRHRACRPSENIVQKAKLTLDTAEFRTKHFPD